MDTTLTRSRRRRRFALVALLAFVVAVSGYAYTATNTIATTKRLGSGATAISGFTISNVRYSRLPPNPFLVRRVTFDISPAALSVRAKTVSTSTTYVTCALLGGGTQAQCTWGVGAAPTWAQVDQLRVIARR